MAESKKPTEAGAQRTTPPADLRRLTNADVDEKKYQGKSALSSGWTIAIPPDLSSTARRLFLGEPKQISFFLSDSTLTAYCILEPEPPVTTAVVDPTKPKTVPLNTSGRNRVYSFSLRDALRSWGIKIPKGELARVPTQVEDVEGLGICLVLNLKTRELEESEKRAPRAPKAKPETEGKKDATKPGGTPGGEAAQKESAAAGTESKSDAPK